VAHQETTVLQAEVRLGATVRLVDQVLLEVILVERAALQVEVRVQDREADDHNQDAHEKDNSFFLDLAVTAPSNGAE
jgi:hypothetical protein